MDNNQLKNYIEDYKQTNNSDLLLKIIYKMKPLILKYSRKLGYIDINDAIQEFTVTLIECTISIENYATESGCLTYYQKAIINKYVALKNSYNKKNDHEIHSEALSNLTKDMDIDDSDAQFIFESFFDGYSKLTDTKKEILLLLYKGYSCSEIAHHLKLSRQYVSKIRNEFQKNYAKKYFV